MDGMGVREDYKELAYLRLRSPKICTRQAVFSDWVRPTHIKTICLFSLPIQMLISSGTPSQPYPE